MMCHCFHQKTQMSQNPFLANLCFPPASAAAISHIWSHDHKCCRNVWAHRTKDGTLDKKSAHLTYLWQIRWKMETLMGTYTFIKNSKHKTEMCVKHRGKTQNTNTSKNQTKIFHTSAWHHLSQRINLSLRDTIRESQKSYTPIYFTEANLHKK